MLFNVSDRIDMLLVGDFNTITYASNILSIKERVHLVNLSSANLTIQNSLLFYVPKSDMESNSYDLEYASYIFANKPIRMEFLYMMNQLLLGNHVLIMIGNYPGMYEMAESLLKFIHDKYGYTGYFITNNDLNDLDMFDGSRFSVPGLMCFDKEKIELDEIYAQEAQQNRSW